MAVGDTGAVTGRKVHSVSTKRNVLVNSKTAQRPPPEETTGHLSFSKHYGNIPSYLPHPLELKRGSNPPLSSENIIPYLWKCTESVTFENRLCKILSQ